MGRKNYEYFRMNVWNEVFDGCGKAMIYCTVYMYSSRVSTGCGTAVQGLCIQAFPPVSYGEYGWPDTAFLSVWVRFL